jgi:hypothetical protein
MKTVIINERQEKILQALNENITVFSFIHHIKDYLKKLLKDPVYSKPDDVLLANGLDAETLKKHLEDCNLILKKERIETHNGVDKFKISYTVSSENAERKIRRLYSRLFETNIVEGTILNEEGEGGATSADASGQFVQPLFGKPIRRKTVYISQKQADELKEEVVMDTAIGDFGYDAPPFKKKKDPTYNHKNMMKKSFKNECNKIQ